MEVSTKEIQQKLLEMFKEINEICLENKIEYILMCGSTLGAFRHKGFIPWDDDLDISMTRANALKLCEIINNKYKEKYFYQTVFNDEGYNILFDKIRLNNTACIEKNGEYHTYHQGLFIDIFVLDNAPVDPKKQKKQLAQFKLYDAILRNDSHANMIKHFGLKIYMALFNRKKIIAKLYKKITQYNSTETGLLNAYCDLGNRRQNIFSYDYFFPAKEIEFEGMTTYVANHVTEYLTTLYGDYMKLPPESDRVGTHGVIVDLHKNYTEYVKNEQR
ncbi:MAG: LicD family protein [Oscillospiraceae bacterium]